MQTSKNETNNITAASLLGAARRDLVQHILVLQLVHVRGLEEEKRRKKKEEKKKKKKKKGESREGT